MTLVHAWWCPSLLIAEVVWAVSEPEVHPVEALSKIKIKV
jgi:hypothetical protein